MIIIVTVINTIVIIIVRKYLADGDRVMNEVLGEDLDLISAGSHVMTLQESEHLKSEFSVLPLPTVSSLVSQRFNK